MKLSSISVLIAAPILLTACNSPDNPRPPKSPAVASTVSGTTAPENESAGRYFDPQKNEWVELKKPSSASSKPTPAPGPSTVAAAADPAPARPARATGVYNSATGKIEWNTGTAEYLPPPAPAPKSARHWWWPF